MSFQTQAKKLCWTVVKE